MLIGLFMILPNTTGAIEVGVSPPVLTITQLEKNYTLTLFNPNDHPLDYMIVYNNSLLAVEPTDGRLPPLVRETITIEGKVRDTRNSTLRIDLIGARSGLIHPGLEVGITFIDPNSRPRYAYNPDEKLRTILSDSDDDNTVTRSSIWQKPAELAVLSTLIALSVVMYFRAGKTKAI